jgi:hypothetical protein|tara:strand:- start:933 stop:1457 length:525 start_codon:yes stop_codon:yes gene_type:complete
MRKEIFAITIFEDTVDLDKIVVPYKDEQLEPTWDSGVPSTFGSQKGVPESTYAYLSEVVNRNLGPAQLMGPDATFGHMWANKYGENDYQDAHMHPNCQWSFIIYVDVYAKTSFLNPSLIGIQNQMGSGNGAFPLDYKPDLGPGSIVIFPSFLIHQVNRGNVGTTISGNIYMDYS